MTAAAREVLDEVVGESLSFLERLCAISSPSGDLVGLRRMAAEVGDRMAPFGLAPEVIDREGPGGRVEPVLVCRGPAAGERSILLIGHLDTVLPAIVPRREAGRFHATGALDMKGGFAMLAGALELLKRTGGTWPDNLELVAVPDEEVGGPISVACVEQWGRTAEAVLVLEPGELRGDAETLVTGRRGLTGWRLEARGVAAHSGLAYWQGRSALAAAGAWCGMVQALSEPGAGPTVNVGRILGGDAELVDALDEHHALLGTSQRLNIVPDRCVAEGEIRFLSAADRDRILERLRDLAHELGRRWEVELDLQVFEEIAPVDPNGRGRALARRLVEAAAADGWTLELEADRGGVSFPNFLPDPDAVPVLDGLGPVGGGMHTREEFMDLRSLERRVPLLAKLLTMLL